MRHLSPRSFKLHFCCNYLNNQQLSMCPPTSSSCSSYSLSCSSLLLTFALVIASFLLVPSPILLYPTFLFISHYFFSFYLSFIILVAPFLSVFSVTILIFLHPPSLSCYSFSLSLPLPPSSLSLSSDSQCFSLTHHNCYHPDQAWPRMFTSCFYRTAS